MPQVIRKTIKYREPVWNEEKQAFEYADKSDNVYFRSIKFRKRARILQDYRGDLPRVDGKVDITQVPQDRDAIFQVSMITESVCDANGLLTLTPDDVDDWSAQKRIAYFKEAWAAQNPTVIEEAKNS